VKPANKPLRRTALTLAIGGLAVFGAAMPAVARDMPFESKIRLKNAFPAFHGKVKSDSPSCIANRKVRLFKEKRGKGDDKLLGKDRTDSSGYWEILKTPKSGVYYAKVNQFSDESTGLSCLPDTSKKVAID
jgi:hypothetical protein